MKLIRLDIQNFLSIEHASLTFEVGIHFVTGHNWDMGSDEDESNGAGKTALFEAIQWSLYGTLARGRVNANDVINKSAGKDCRVQLVFSHNGHTYTVLRTRLDSEFGTGTKFWIDGEEQTSHREGDTKEDLSDFLPVNETIFRHAVQVGQGMPDRFLTLSESDKHDLICRMINLTIFDKALARSKAKRDEAKLNKGVSEGALNSLFEQAEKWLLEKSNLEQQIEQHQRENAESIAAAQTVEAHLKETLKNLEAEIHHTSNEIASHDSELEELKGRYSEVEHKYTVASTEVNARHGDVHQRYNDLVALTQQISRINKDVEAARDNPHKCVLCNKVPNFKPATQCESYREFFEEKGRERQGLVELYEQRGAEYTPLQAEFAKWQSSLTEVTEARQKLTQDIQVVQNHILTLRRRLDERRVEQGRAEQEKQKLNEQIRTHQQKIDTLTQRLTYIEEMHNNLLSEAEEKREMVNEHHRLAVHWKYWVDNIPNLRATAVSQILSFVNERIAHYMEVLSSGAMGVSLYHKAHGKGSRIQVDLLTPGGTYVASSGGERRRVDLAVFLSLFDLLQVSSGVKFNVLVCDEIMDSLSPVGVKKFMEVLKRKAEEGTAVFVVSHNPSVQDVSEFDTVYRVERQGGKARLYSNKETVRT